MKLIKSVKLTFQEGNSDKVYEVDLCELVNDSEQRFLVNFRYGWRGNNLKEGTKTPLAVDYQTALDIYNSVVVAKTNKGYVDSDTPQSHSGSSVKQSSNFDLTTYLAQINKEPDSKQRARLIWRLPQQPNQKIADQMVAGLTKGEWVETYSRLWVIGRTGDSQHGPAVMPLTHHQDSKLSSLAFEVLIKLNYTSALQLCDQLLNELPAGLVQALNARQADEISKQLNLCLYNKTSDYNALLKNLYLVAANHIELHQALLSVLAIMPIQAGWFKGLRYIFKMAEFRLDSQMFALLAHRFETSEAGFHSEYYWHYSRDGKPSRIQQEMAKPDCQYAFSNRTKDYLRRRSWRALKRLGISQDQRYVEMASAVLLSFSDSDKQPEKRRDAYDWRTRSSIVTQYGPYASYLALNHLLYQHSQCYKLSLKRTSWLKVSSQSESQRTEAFPALWDQYPDKLFELLIKGKIEPVQLFAVKALRANSEYCQQLSDQQLYQLLTSGVPYAIELAVDLLAQRNISSTLMVYLFKSGHPKACQLAIEALQQIHDIFAQPQLLAQLLTIDEQQLRDYLTSQWQQHQFTAVDYALLTTTIELALADSTTWSIAHANWLADLFNRYLTSAVYDLPIDTINHLLQHRSLPQTELGLQLLAARLLVHNRISFSAIPEPILAQLLESDSAELRSAGLALYSKTSDYELLERLPSLIELVYHGEPTERQACFNLFIKLLPTYAHQVFNQLLPLVFKAEQQPGQQQALFDFVEQHLAKERNQLDKDTVWRLLHASAVSAQNMGAAALLNQSPVLYSVKQWAVLSHHVNVTIRQFSWQVFENHLSLVKQHSLDALRLLESPWLDSREFGFAFFKQQYQESDWTVDLIVSICDSNLPDTQNFGRLLLQTYFKPEQGQHYLQALSQHPSIQVQGFVSHLLNDYAAGKPEIIISLQGYFTSVLSQINKGRVSKDCVLTFLSQQANCHPDVLTMVAQLFSRLSLTLVHKDKAQLIKTMLLLKKQHPELDLPLTANPLRAVGVQGENHAS